MVAIGLIGVVPRTTHVARAMEIDEGGRGGGAFGGGNIGGGGGGGVIDPSPVAEGTGKGSVKGMGNLLQASSKSEGLASVEDLPENIQSSVKSFFKGGSTKYTDFSVKQESNGKYVASMVKPGNVPLSKAIYYKVISPEGETISVYKDTFDPAGNLVHSKPKN